MVEITNIWIDLVTEIRSSRPELAAATKDKNRILRKSEESTLSTQCAAIVKTIGSLRELLVSNRDDYMLGQLGDGRGMSPQDMDTLDSSADHICFKCSELIQNYAALVSKAKLGTAARNHYDLVTDGLKEYLKKVLSIHSEMRAVRVKRQVQQKNLTKLELNSRESRSHQIHTVLPAAPSNIDIQERSISAAAAAKSDFWDDSDMDEELSAEEAQLLEQESHQLIEQLQNLNNQVDQTASKVIQISELQQIFSDKVMQQSADIEHIHTQAVSTTENVKEGNEAVRQAIQNQASYRVIVLFVLLVFSFALLFLDWYND